MRLAAAATLLLLATPAAAQRLDTRRINVRETPTATICGFNAYREMELIDGTKAGNGKTASWIGAASGDPGARMRLAWRPAAASSWSTPPFLGVGFTVPAGPALNRDTVAAASIVIDGGKPFPLQYNASGDKLLFNADRDTDDVGARIVSADSVILEIHDSAGTALRRYRWDTRRLEEAVETVAVVGWRCTSP